MELEVSMGQWEQTCMQHDIFIEMNSLLGELIQPGRKGKYHYATDYEVKEGADYEVQRGTEGAGVGCSEEKNLVNLSRQYKYKVKEMMMGGSTLAW